MDTWILRYSDTRILRYLDSRILGYLDTWILNKVIRNEKVLRRGQVFIAAMAVMVDLEELGLTVPI